MPLDSNYDFVESCSPPSVGRKDATYLTITEHGEPVNKLSKWLMQRQLADSGKPADPRRFFRPRPWGLPDLHDCAPVAMESTVHHVT